MKSPEQPLSVSSSELHRLARRAGLRGSRNPTLETVEQRRLQLWLVGMLVLLVMGAAFALVLVRGESALPAWLSPTTAQIGSIALVALFGFYALEKDMYLRRLSAVLVKERVLTKSTSNRVRELNILLEAAKSMNFDLGLEEVLKTISRCARGLLDARGSKILLSMGEREFRAVSGAGRSSDSDEFLAQLVRVKRQPALSRGLDNERGSGHEVMCVPLVHREEFLGVITVTGEAGKKYSEHDLRALSLFGEQAASAVANAKFHEEQRLFAFRSSFQASHDSLTRLPGRNLFLDKLKRLIDKRRKSGRGFSVLFVDLDRFKRINDGLGHAAGDAVLMECGMRIRRAIGERDLAARFGGDEFIVLSPTADSRHAAFDLAERVVESISATIQVSSRDIRLSCSMGIAVWNDRIDAETLIGNADIAVQKAKLESSSIVVYNESMRSRMLDEIKLELSLKQALEKNLLSAYYQPVRRLDDGGIAGVEALVRWCPPGEKPVPAQSFISTAHRSGLLPEMDTWLLDDACSVAQALRPGPDGIETPIHVNVHPSHLRFPDLLKRFERALDRHGLPPSRLVLEITEYAVVEDSATVRNTLKAFKNLGARLALDDFGVGFSSLSYLTRLPIDILKIDQSFVTGLGDSSDELKLIETILKMGDLLNLQVIAEGIETDYQVECLKQIGCPLGQGNYLGPPVPASGITGAAGYPAGSLPDEEGVPVRKLDEIA